MSTTNQQIERIKVGDWVSFLYGAGNLIARVIEDRGPLSTHRRRLYGVRVDRESSEPEFFEMPEDELELVTAPDKESIVNYLTDGGLVEILRSNLGGGRNPPRVWMTYTPRGGVTHTYVKDRGMIGGASVPFFALQENRVFKGKVEEVRTFLADFGLDRADADEILAAVGTSP